MSSMMIGSKERPLRVAVIGSGPSGFYAAEALMRQSQFSVLVDMFERLPTPFGLARGGVAPDHQKIKAVMAVYERIAAMPGFHYFGHVTLGRDIQVADLKSHYDQIVYAVGCEKDRQLGIPGEDLLGNHSATSFVGWYNGHPDYREEKFDLTQERVAVVGVGNVAMDVTRILTEDPEHLAKTDIAHHAVQALRQSKVREVLLLGRRGVAQAAFSLAEIQELGHLAGCDLVVSPDEVKVEGIAQSALADPVVAKKTAFLTEQSKLGEGVKSKKIRLRFLVSPVEIIGENGRIKAVKIEKNALVPDGKGGVKAKGTGEFEILPVGLVFRSVGYHGVAIQGVSFDEKSGHIPNDKGRVLEGPGGSLRQGEYVVGWAKRGPSGLIGTNRADSQATVDLMIEDVKAGRWGWAAPSNGQGNFGEFLKQRGVKSIGFSQWKVLDKLELERGAKSGKIREKFTKIDEMLSAVDLKIS